MERLSLTVEGHEGVRNRDCNLLVRLATPNAQMSCYH